MGLVQGRKLLIVNAPDQFLNTLLDDGYRYTIGGVDLGLGILFVDSKQEAEESLTIVSSLLSKSGRVWVATANSLQKSIFLDLEPSVASLNLKCQQSLPLGSDWSAICIETI